MSRMQSAPVINCAAPECKAWLGGSTSTSKLEGLHVFEVGDEDAFGPQWKSEVARLEEEMGQLRSTAAWALPRLAKPSLSYCPDAVVEVEPEPHLDEWPLLPPTPVAIQRGPRTEGRPEVWPSLPPTPVAIQKEPLRLAEASAHSYCSHESEDHMIFFGASDSTPRGRTRDVKITESSTVFTRPKPIQAPLSPTPQISCDRSSASSSGPACDDGEMVSLSELTQLVENLEHLEQALQKAKQENTVLRRDKVTREEAWELALQKLQQENAALREERCDAGAAREKALELELDMLREESVALREEAAAREVRHSRDVAELEGMLEPVMADNSQLRTSLQAAEVRLDATCEPTCEPEATCEPTCEPEPDVEVSCDIDRSLSSKSM